MKPMLAHSKEVDLDTMKYPMLISPKLDGIRCIIRNGVPLSRSLKPIPNEHVHNMLYDAGLEGFDGELIVTGDFNSVQSAIMSTTGQPEFTYNVFDLVDCPKLSFVERLALLNHRYHKLDELTKLVVRLVPQLTVNSSAETRAQAFTNLVDGFEGSILRSPKAKYKFGRSTAKEAGMLKLVEWHRSEAIVISLEELMHNENPATINEVGASVRSHEQAGLVPGGKLGALVCELVETGRTFKIGTGFSDFNRVAFWATDSIGKTVTFKFKEFSKYGVPRHPVFCGFRHTEDMS